MWGIFLPVIACGMNYCLPRYAMHSVREINVLQAAGMKHWLSIRARDISWILQAMSPSDLGQNRLPSVCASVLGSSWIFKSFKSLKNWQFLNQAIIHGELSLNGFLAQMRLFKWCGLELPLAMGTSLISLMVTDCCRHTVVILKTCDTCAFDPVCCSTVTA